MIDRDDWLTALREIESVPDPSALAISEIAAIWGIGERATRRRLTEMERAGKARRTWKYVPTAQSPRGVKAMAYVLVKETTDGAHDARRGRRGDVGRRGRSGSGSRA